MQRKCKYHGMTEYSIRKNGHIRCRKCVAEGVQRRRKKVKRILVEEAGGKCIRCDYDKCYEALQFHHRNPEEKEFGIGSKGLTRGLDILRKEAKKCDLLCSNCHKEIEFQ